jgi:hypothetical protein
MFQEAYPMMLQNELMNSNEVINLNGIKFTAAELRNNNLALPMKEAAINVMQRRILERSGIHQYSDSMLRLTKTNEAIAKAKDSLMATHKSRYNITSSQNIRNRANIQWDVAQQKPGGVTGEDLHLFLITSGNTVDNKNQILGNAGGWNHVMSKLKAQGIDKHNPALADEIGNLVIPDALAIQVGARKGATYAQHWPGRFSQLKRDIKKGYSDQVKAELTYQQAEGKEIQAEFIEAGKAAGQNGETLSTAEVNEWKAKFSAVGLPIPDSVTKYETATMRDEREDKQQIEAMMAANNGVITNEELDQFHPIAALEYRDKATKLEKAALKEFGAEKKIKAHLDTAFTNMGIKGNEKSPAYVEAMENAKVDYANKYNKYVAMGYDPAMASHLALHATEVQNPETGKPEPDSMGVLTEIRTNGEGSKYVITGQSIEKEMKPGTLRVARIASGKREIKDDPNIIFNGTIGGDYGSRQLDSIIANIEKHGPDKGIRIDKGARKYYEGLARGRDGNWQGLLDAQLKARGHVGLWPAERPPEQDLFEGKTMTGELLDDPFGTLPLAKEVERAGKYPSPATFSYSQNMLRDCTSTLERYPHSIWCQPEYQYPWISGPYNPWIDPRTPIITGGPYDPTDPPIVQKLPYYPNVKY